MLRRRCLRFMAPPLISIGILLAGTSCTYRIRAQTEFSLPASAMKVIPLRAAIIIRPEYRNFAINHQPKYPLVRTPISYALGDSLFIGWKKISESLFREAVIYEAINAETQSPGHDVIVIPDITEASFYVLGGGGLQAARIETKWTILDSHLKEIYVNTFVGEATRKVKTFQNANKELGRLMDAAVLESYSKAFEGLRAVEWWKDILKTRTGCSEPSLRHRDDFGATSGHF